MTRIFLIISLFCVGVFAQTKTELQRLVETEENFAKTAAEKGTKPAFIEFLADDGIIFEPTETNGKKIWQARPDSPALLSWRPNRADISSDGKLGYTTGGWEFRPKGKTDEAVAFGEYVTLWKKQPDGNFKAVLDIGITHEKPAGVKFGWSSPPDAGTGELQPKNLVTNGTLTDIFSKRILSDALFRYYAEDVYVLREGQKPLFGKTPAFLALEKLDKNFPPRSAVKFNGTISPAYGNLMYAYGIYQLTNADKSINRWNFMQIWKYRDGRWQIVLDLMNPIKEG